MEDVQAAPVEETEAGRPEPAPDEGAGSSDEERVLTAEEILAGGDEPFKRVEIPELPKGGEPGVVFLRSVSAGEVLDFIQIPEGKKQNDALIRLIADVVVSKDGEPLFSETEAEDIRRISIGAFNRIQNAVLKRAGMPTGEPGESAETGFSLETIESAMVSAGIGEDDRRVVLGILKNVVGGKTAPGAELKNA